MTLILNNLSEDLQKKIERRAREEQVPLEVAAAHMLGEAPEAGATAAAAPTIGNGLDWFFASGALDPVVLRAMAEHDIVVEEG